MVKDAPNQGFQHKNPGYDLIGPSCLDKSTRMDVRCDLGFDSIFFGFFIWPQQIQIQNSKVIDRQVRSDSIKENASNHCFKRQKPYFMRVLPKNR